MYLWTNQVNNDITRFLYNFASLPIITITESIKITGGGLINNVVSGH